MSPADLHDIAESVEYFLTFAGIALMIWAMRSK